MERQKVLDFLREYEKFRRQTRRLQEDQSLKVLFRKHSWTEVYEELNEYEKKLETQRTAQKVSLQKQLTAIQNGVRKFQTLLTDVKPTSDLIKKLNEIMSEVELSMTNLKEEQRSRLEEYQKEQKTCSLELRAFEKKIETWDVAVQPSPQPPVSSTLKTRVQDRDLPTEVRALEDFLQKTGGPYGGWDQFDHQTFLRVWIKHSGKPSYRKQVQLYLPSKTLEEVEQHEDWHQEMLILKDRKREAIQHWKANKHQERQARIQSREEMEQEQTAQNPTEQHRFRSNDEKMETTRRLEEWRKEKKRREEQEAEQRMDEESKKAVLQMEKRRRQLEVKKSVEERLRLRREKEEEQGRRKREEEKRGMEERQEEAARRIRFFRERDLLQVEEKLNEKQQREKEEEERRRRVSAQLKNEAEGHVTRDPSRLSCLTKAWQERMKHPGPSGGGPVLQEFHRAVPTWRQGL